MDLLQVIFLWLGISSLYLGFGGVLGVLLRRVISDLRYPLIREIAAAHTLLLFLPASILVLHQPGMPLWIRISLTATALSLTALGTIRPNWFPARCWERPYAHRYFAATMALSALWGISQTMATQAPASILVACAAGLTGAASWFQSLRST